MGVTSVSPTPGVSSKSMGWPFIVKPMYAVIVFVTPREFSPAEASCMALAPGKRATRMVLAPGKRATCMPLAPGKRPTGMELAPGKRATRMALVPGKRAGMALAPGKRPTCMALAPGKRATRMALVPGKRATGMALASRIVSRVITCRSRQACLLLYQGE